MTSRLFEFVEGVELLNHNKVVMSDHCSYLINVNIENCFNNPFSVWDLVNSASLNPSKQSYRIIFSEELEEQLKTCNTGESFSNPCSSTN